MEVLKTMMRVRARGDIAIIFITHNEVHSKLVADRFTFLALGEVIGKGTKQELADADIRHLMAGGAQIRDLEKELADVALS
jgi:simple sugar transport system ATP-binding protein